MSRVIKAMTVNYHHTTSRRAWMMRTIPEIIRRAGKALTLAQITAELGTISNPSYFAPRRRKKQPWEYHLGVQSYPEVKLILKRLIEKFVLIEDKNRRPYDPRKGRIRYDLMNPLDALARVQDSDDNQGPSASLLTAWATKRRSAIESSRES